MIAFLDTSEDLSVCSLDLGGMEVGQLLTPLSGFKNRGGRFAIDNGAFAGFDRHKFILRLARELPNVAQCQFVAVPDVVCNARRTIEVFRRWESLPEMQPWPLALVLQNGIENLDIPWDAIEAVFVGGDDKFKESKDARDCAVAARALSKWVHVGRVNGKGRFDLWEPLMDSFDGTGVAQYTRPRQRIAESATPLLDGLPVASMATRP